MEKIEVSRAPSQELSIVEQVALDLATYLENYPNISFALKILSKDSGLSEKTLRRLINKENNPSYQTLFKLYLALLDTDNESEVLTKCPKVIKEKLESVNPEKIRKCVPKTYDFHELIKSHPVLAEIYILAGIQDVSVSNIVYRFGQYGADCLTKLENLEIVSKVGRGKYRLAEKQPQLNGAILKNFGLRFIDRYLKDEESDIEGTNFIGFFAEGLNAAGKKRWLEIDQASFLEKVEVGNDEKYKGSELMFSFQGTDNICEAGMEIK
jgi:transcriptional regulator with XRE-family HTH domain